MGRNFQFCIKGSPDLFWQDISPLGWSLERDGPVQKHSPSLLRARLADLSQKWFLIVRAYIKILSLVRKINKKFDTKEWELTVGSEWWDLVLFINYVFFEARALLDIIQKVHILLYSSSNKLPESFNDFLKKETHIAQVENDKYRTRLKSIKNSGWFGFLCDHDGRPSIRDLQVHHAQIQLTAAPDNQGVLQFKLCISRGVNFPPRKESTLPLDGTMKSIIDGLKTMIEDFRPAVIDKATHLGWANKTLQATPTARFAAGGRA
jgi:hypothetical protein